MVTHTKVVAAVLAIVLIGGGVFLSQTGMSGLQSSAMNRPNIGCEPKRITEMNTLIKKVKDTYASCQKTKNKTDCDFYTKNIENNKTWKSDLQYCENNWYQSGYGECEDGLQSQDVWCMIKTDPTTAINDNLCLGVKEKKPALTKLCGGAPAARSANDMSDITTQTNKGVIIVEKNHDSSATIIANGTAETLGSYNFVNNTNTPVRIKKIKLGVQNPGFIKVTNISLMSGKAEQMRSSYIDPDVTTGRVIDFPVDFTLGANSTLILEAIGDIGDIIIGRTDTIITKMSVEYIGDNISTSKTPYVEGQSMTLSAAQ